MSLRAFFAKQSAADVYSQQIGECFVADLATAEANIRRTRPTHHRNDIDRFRFLPVIFQVCGQTLPVEFPCS